MKNNKYIIIPSAAVLTALVVFQWSGKDRESGSLVAADKPDARGHSTASARQPEEFSFASKGMLWETVATNAREREKSSMTIPADSLAEAMTSDVGETVTLRFSDRFPDMRAQVMNRTTQPCGTVVTGLLIPGDPEGRLIIDENASMDYFQAQLDYDNHAVAYKFEKSAEGLLATRHILSDLLCAEVNRKTGEVVHIGLPVMDETAIAKAIEPIEGAGGDNPVGDRSEDGGNDRLSLEMAAASPDVDSGAESARRYSSRPVPIFNSLPDAEAVIYLDMDGQVVNDPGWTVSNDFKPINALGITEIYSDNELLEIYHRVAEDFSPFKINITTDESRFLRAPSNRRQRVIFTPTRFMVGVGGVAKSGSFSLPVDRVCWVFTNNTRREITKYASLASHEIGHTLLLGHDGDTSATEPGDREYYRGHGDNPKWSAIMGNANTGDLEQWSKGEYRYANNMEDDLAIITGRINGFGYRRDMISDIPLGATPLHRNLDRLSANGILETREDRDVYRFSTRGGLCSFTAKGSDDGSNLDIRLEILDFGRKVIGSSDQDSSVVTSATVTTTLRNGTYFLRVSGVGRGDVLGTGYSDYGSLGQYTVTGTAP